MTRSEGRGLPLRACLGPAAPSPSSSNPTTTTGPAASEAARDSGAGPLSNRLLIRTWNLSGWSAANARTVFEEVGADVLALQETHLAALPLQWAHNTMRAVDRHLLHGHPVPAMAGSTYAKSCGVGFVLRSGVPAAAALPVGGAWR